MNHVTSVMRGARRCDEVRDGAFKSCAHLRSGRKRGGRGE